MKKIISKIIISIFLLLCILPLGYATTVEVFYGDGCPHCAKALSDLSPYIENHTIEIMTYEVYFNQTNQLYFQERMQQANMTLQGVPTFVVGNSVFVGYNDEIREQVITLSRTQVDPVSNESIISQGSTVEVSLLAVIMGAVVDAINPCAFAVLIILLTSLLSKKQTKKIIYSGIAFSLAIFISYFCMGLGLYQALTFIKANIFYAVVGIFAIILGLLNLKDVFWYGKWFVMEVPMSWRPNLKALIKKVTSPIGSFFVGFLVSLFLLPCTSGPYIAVLGLLAKETSAKAVSYLFLYNAIFVLPMIVITLLVAKGIDVAKLEEKRKKHLTTLHLIEAVVLLTLGVLLLWYMI